MFARLPSYGLYCRHVSGLKLDNVRVTSTVPEERPALHCESVTDLRVERFEATVATDQPALRFVNVRDAVVSGCTVPSQTGAALEIAGAGSSGIRLMGNDFTRAAKAVDFKTGATESALQAK